MRPESWAAVFSEAIAANRVTPKGPSFIREHLRDLVIYVTDSANPDHIPAAASPDSKFFRVVSSDELAGAFSLRGSSPEGKSVYVSEALANDRIVFAAPLERGKFYGAFLDHLARPTGVLGWDRRLKYCVPNYSDEVMMKVIAQKLSAPGLDDEARKNLEEVARIAGYSFIR